MFTRGVVPCLDVNNGCVVRGVSFANLQDVGDSVGIAVTYDKTGADELISLDITTSSDNHRTVVDMTCKVVETIFIPFTMSGGIRTVEDFRMLLRESTGKVSIDSSAIDNPYLINDSTDKSGRQCVVVAIGAKRGTNGKGWNIYKHDGYADVGIDVLEWAIETGRLEVGEILLISIGCDGTRNGYDNELVSLIASHVSMSVTASGGAGSKEYFYDALTEGGTNAVLATSLFRYKELEIRDLKEYLSEEGVAVRIQRRGWDAGAGDFDGGSRTGSMVDRVKHVPVFHGWKHMGRSG